MWDLSRPIDAHWCMGRSVERILALRTFAISPLGIEELETLNINLAMPDDLFELYQYMCIFICSDEHFQIL